MTLEHACSGALASHAVILYGFLDTSKRGVQVTTSRADIYCSAASQQVNAFSRQVACAGQALPTALHGGMQSILNLCSKPHAGLWLQATPVSKLLFCVCLGHRDAQACVCQRPKSGVTNFRMKYTMAPVKM